jgi:iron-sulfur cluster assembly enzyme ISCU, mitochondrial
LQIHPTAPLDTQIVFAMFSLSLLKRVKFCQKGTIFARLYHENIIDHYENPRNVGSLDKKKITVGTGLVGAPACGDVMKLQFEVDDTGRIIDAKFKTFGCGSAIASSSVATEWLKGKTVDECLTIKVKMLSIL